MSVIAEAGFADPVRDATRAFRAIMTALANPGQVQRLDYAMPIFKGIDAAAVTVLLTLADHDTPVWLPPGIDPGLADYLRFHCGCAIAAEPRLASFGVIAGEAASAQAFGFPLGSDEYPDRSATVLVQVASLTGGTPRTLAGPGIRDTCRIAPTLDDAFWAAWRRNTAQYPRGVDLFLVCGRDILGLPRSSQLKE
jgi:alpha-D-ribose 1-methylphosphonate 5-triphosphate synthase subunit PhnH